MWLLLSRPVVLLATEFLTEACVAHKPQRVRCIGNKFPAPGSQFFIIKSSGSQSV